MRLSNRLKRVKKKGEIDIDMEKEKLNEILKAHSIWLQTRFTDDVNGEQADLRGVEMSGVDLSLANMRGVNMRGAKMRGSVCPMCCPEKGEFTGFKKVPGDYIVELRITESAKRSSAITRKCRCSEAVVVNITDLYGKEVEEKTVYSKNDSNFRYTVGETVRVDDFDENRWNECSTGIHFFITRKEAVDYIL